MAAVHKYKTAEELEAAVDSYFVWLKEEDRKPTISGMAYHLGFASRQSFYDYCNAKDNKLASTMQRARLRIESIYEERLHGNAASGAIFALKNFGWTDKQESDVNIRTGGETLLGVIQSLEADKAGTG